MKNLVGNSKEILTFSTHSPSIRKTYLYLNIAVSRKEFLDWTYVLFHIFSF